jgi:hypothetical protein
MTEPDGGTKPDTSINGPNMVGTSNECNLTINNVPTSALLDTGSCVSTVGEQFYTEQK